MVRCSEQWLAVNSAAVGWEADRAQLAESKGVRCGGGKCEGGDSACPEGPRPSNTAVMWTVRPGGPMSRTVGLGEPMNERPWMGAPARSVGEADRTDDATDIDIG